MGNFKVFSLNKRQILKCGKGLDAKDKRKVVHQRRTKIHPKSKKQPEVEKVWK